MAQYDWRGHTFRIGNELSPERLTFTQFAGEQPLCANVSGTDYYRFFTA